MSKEILIEPLTYHGPGCCPICLTALIVAERDTTIMELDKSGNVISIEGAVHTICKGMCPKCGYKLDMMRSNGIYRPYSEAVALFDKIDFEYELSLRQKDGIYHIDGNPLSV